LNNFGNSVKGIKTAKLLSTLINVWFFIFIIKNEKNEKM
jgi:hypothetical protein